MLKKIGIGIAALLVVLLIVIAVQPSEFTFTRSITIDAPPQVVFNNLNDLHRWEEWSPWAKLDPQAKNVYEGPATGVGAAHSWAGNDKVGEGKMTITESTPPAHLGLVLEFKKPMAATNTVSFDVVPQANGSEVTWTMKGKNDFMGKAFFLFASIDKVLGPDFEKGLAQLKTLSEAKQN